MSLQAGATIRASLNSSCSPQRQTRFAWVRSSGGRQRGSNVIESGAPFFRHVYYSSLSTGFRRRRGRSPEGNPGPGRRRTPLIQTLTLSSACWPDPLPSTGATFNLYACFRGEPDEAMGVVVITILCLHHP